ncbi:MAG: LacI family transcriptional regulator [Firmicutes bacterium]|nr:LacI family transcriptional regulator [Bacillota bacterium]
MTTIRDVAKKAGVSFKTVSRVINGDPYVSAETMAKVKRVIEELGYRPNITARSLATKRTFLIGLVIPEFTSPAYAMMVQGIEDVSAVQEYGVLLCRTRHSRKREEALIENLASSKRVDGILLFSNRIDAEFFTQIKKKYKLPLVVIDRDVEDEEIPCVFTNNREGTYRTTAHLIKAGRTKIAYITPVIDTTTTLERLEGYEQAMREHGLSYQGRTLVDHTGDREKGFAAMLRLLDREDPPDGVVAFNDLLAIGAMQAIKERGLRIPEDIAVVGFDDIEAASVVEPALTTVRQPLREIGETACKMLLQLINGEEVSTRRVVFEPTLVVRKSCGTGVLCR